MTSSAVDPVYDIIFAGGGSAACLTASRLATASPNLKILVLEAGQHTKDKPEHVQPGQYIVHLTPTSTTTRCIVAKPSEKLDGRSVVVQSAHAVGGGSSVNVALYNFPAASDFDDWGTKGWAAKDMIPLLKKVETYQVNPGYSNHGYQGPLKVSYGGHFGEVGKQLLEFGPKIDPRRAHGEEANNLDEKSINVFAKWPKWIDEITGRRSDVPHAFIYDKPRPNLHVVAGALVKRIIIENKRATGVEFLFSSNPDNLGERILRTVKASKLVIVSAGALGSPAILERSGIGAAEVLKKAGVEQVVELPGVGATYRDHIFGVVPYIGKDDLYTYDLITRGDIDVWTNETKKWMMNGKGLLGSNGVDAAIKIRPFPDELATIGPAFEKRWTEFYASKPDKPLFWMSALLGLPADQSALPPLRYISAGYSIAYPISTGSVHITAGDVDAPLDFETGFLNEQSDVEVFRWAYKKSREYLRRLPAFRGAFLPAHPLFPEGSKTLLNETEPTPVDAPDIVYSREDDDAIDKFHRKWVATTWHSLGTCPMKALADGGVVDHKLNVYGVEGLKVADISIPPGNVGANTYSTALAIGEKAALIIAEELGITGV